MSKKRAPSKGKGPGKSRKGKYLKPLLIAGGSLLAMTRSAQGLPSSVIICCLTERLRASLRSVKDRRRLMDDAVTLLAPPAVP